MKAKYRFLAVFTGILIFMGIAYLFLLFTSMTDDANEINISFNRAINYIFGFPLVFYNESFPLLLSSKDFWTIKNIALVIANTSIQSFILIGIWKLIKSLKK